MRKPFSLTGTAHSKTPYRLVHNGPVADRYADRSLSGGTAKIDSRQSIEGETDRRRSIEGEKGKKKKRRRRKKTIHTSFPRAVLARMSSLPTHCPRPRVAPTPSSPTGDSRARRKIEGPLTTGGLLCRYYILQFRAAIQLQFDFHRAIYNLGTVLYGLAEDTFRSGRPINAKEVSPDELYSQSAIYIAAAHALKPNYSVYLCLLIPIKFLTYYFKS
ncbi:hypothetical protein BHM03_00020453 [Ensete ventricosum]|nr:hypothetical protein BHM03_00020453 [Ensete ventricosum]